MRQDFTGRLAYLTAHEAGAHRLLVAIDCFIGTATEPDYALVDTGSEWCILTPEIAQDLGYLAGQEGDPVLLHSRFGPAWGRLMRIPIRFAAAQGEDLEFEATWFVSEEWLGPTVIGWRGCLERIRFAFDTDQEWFYFTGSARGAG